MSGSAANKAAVRGSATGKHLAVVPVAWLDPSTERALDYAGTLAPHVLALHVRQVDSESNGDFEGAWAKRAPRVPLVVVDASPRDRWRGALVRALRTLRRTGQAEHITVVIPQRQPVAGPQQRLSLSATGFIRLRLALLLTPGVVVKGVPTQVHC